MQRIFQQNEWRGGQKPSDMDLMFASFGSDPSDFRVVMRCIILGKRGKPLGLDKRSSYRSIEVGFAPKGGRLTTANL